MCTAPRSAGPTAELVKGLRAGKGSRLQRLRELMGVPESLVACRGKTLWALLVLETARHRQPFILGGCSQSRRGKLHRSADDLQPVGGLEGKGRNQPGCSSNPAARQVPALRILSAATFSAVTSDFHTLPVS